jgi:hypothetical protein
MPSHDDQAATKHDLEQVRTVLTTDIHQVKTDIDHVRTELTAHLHDVRTELKGEIHQVRLGLDGLRGRVDQVRDEVVEHMRDMQTEVLRAFYDWARPIELKLRSIPPIEERLGLLEERVSRIERGDKPLSL